MGFIELITQEVDSLENFLVLLKEEEEYLLKNHFDLLRDSIQKREKALIRSRILEKNRKDITTQISRDLKIEQNKTSLFKVSQLLDSSYSSKIDDLQKTLLGLHRKVEIQRKKNEELIKDSMVYMDQDMKLLLESAENSYLANDLFKKNQTKPTLIVDKVS